MPARGANAFRDGFIGSAVGSLLGPTLSENLPNDFIVQGAAAALVGGTASVMAGGKFANGAISAAFTHLFNAMSQLQGREPGVVGAALGKPDCWCCVILDGVHVHPETLRLAIESIHIEVDGVRLKITASIGVAVQRFDQESMHAIQQHADQAMYEAKRGGRNRVSTFGSDGVGLALPAM